MDWVGLTGFWPFIAALALAAAVLFRIQRHRAASALARTKQDLLEARQQMEDRIVERTAQLRDENEALRQNEQALRMRERRYRIISELMADYSYAARVHEDGSFDIEWIAGAFSRLTGYSPEEAQALNWLSITHPEDRDDVVASLLKAIRGELEEFECRIFTKSGEIRWMMARVMGLRNPETGDVVIYTAGHDITQEKSAEIENLRLRDRMREAQKLESLGSLAGGIAHDFNNLLSVILGNATLLIRDLPERSDLTNRATRIRTSALYAAELTTQMLTYAGDTPINNERIAISDIVTDMAQLMDAGTNRDVDIDLELNGESGELRGDTSKIRQVVMNLITNAAEALEADGGTIRLRTGRTPLDADELSGMQVSTDAVAGEYVFLEVSDDGPGMDPEASARLFEPFYSTKFSGRGLGLAVVLGIVRAHHGAIRVDSRSGEGTRIRVFFPSLEGPSNDFPTQQTEYRAEQEPGALREGGGTPDDASRAGAVLVIDDEEAVAELTQIVLERAGFDVLVAAGGREGLEIYEKNSAGIVLVVLDLMMPDLGGREVFNELHQLNPHLPVLVTSGYTHEIASRRASTLERTGFVQKPFEPEDLLASVAALLGRGVS
jgi:two-component system cell cycle sensor histidine kinase/response regulator CckA